MYDSGQEAGSVPEAAGLSVASDAAQQADGRQHGVPTEGHLHLPGQGTNRVLRGTGGSTGPHSPLDHPSPTEYQIFAV